jgi:hypothetical protein
MSTSAPAADRLSLTLPDWRSALKRRVRRPRKPNWRRVIYLFVMLMNVLYAYVDFSSGRVAKGANDALFVFVMWVWSEETRRHPGPHRWGGGSSWSRLVDCVAVAAVVWDLALG